MKLIASGVTNSAASVRSPSFSRSSSSTTTTIRPALISATAFATSANIVPAFQLHLFRRIPSYVPRKKETLPTQGSVLFLQPNYKIETKHLQRGLNLESPRLKKRLRNVLRILVSTGPLTEPCRTNVLIGCELEFLHNLLERCYRWNNRPDWLRLAPVGITTTLCHVFVSTSSIFDSALRVLLSGKLTQPSF